VKVNDDQIQVGHGLHSLAVAAGGRVYLAWLDERNVAKPRVEATSVGHKHEEPNSEVFVATSTDGGRSFAPNRRVASDVCPCCKTSLAVGPDARLYVSWRQVLPGSFRHIAVASSSDGGSTFSGPAIVSDDRWKLDGCPVSGAALALDQGSLRVVWYAEGDAGPAGLYTSESRDGGKSFAPRQLVREAKVRGTPVLIAGEPLPPASNGAGLDDDVVAAAATADRILRVYVTKDGDRRSVSVATSSRAR
jgi:hypothetical protein